MMFNRVIANGKSVNLYRHQTDGGAEYLTDKYTICPNGGREGVFEGATVVIRTDGNELEFCTAAELGLNGAKVNDMRALLKMLRMDVLPEPARSLAEKLVREI